MLLEHAWGQPLQNPIVVEALLGRDALLRVPLEAPGDEVDEAGVRHLPQLGHNVFEALLSVFLGQNHIFVLGLRSGHRSLLFLFKLSEQMLSTGPRQHGSVGEADHVDDQLDLFALIGAREQRETGKELNEDTAQTPHVNLLGVGEYAEHDIWGAVEARLDISVDNFVFEAARSEVGNDDARLVFLFHEDIFGLQIAVNDAEFL